MDVDERIEELARRQHGAIAVRQARQLGLDRHAQQRRVRKGRSVLATPRVLVVRGSPRTPEQRLMIATLDAWPEGIASHAAAAWLWRLPHFDHVAEIIRDRGGNVPTSSGGHRPKLLLPHHRTSVNGIPCTTLPRTLVDLGSVVPPARLERIVDRVVTQSPAMLPALHTTFDELAKRGRPGIAAMRGLLAERPVGAVVRATGLERRFEEILGNAGEQPLRRQIDVGGHSWLGRVDYVDDEVRLLVEVDSALHHTSVSDKRRDAARDDAMRAAGFREVLRVTDTMVWQRPWEVVEAVRDVRRRLRQLAA
jgi:very-short-patch-repair endonuclease